MDSLAPWAWWITAGVAGFAFLMVGVIDRFLHRTMWPLSIGVTRFGPEQARNEAAILAPLG